ncbi:MAG: Rid family detoxifying hydrolase [Candidatus Marinimicrobia bacterium]|jgi:2-iminobutanoate/2-iminopropanoate deaminase|nr:Rid family detoxifying hydrolase [Candidatus Neomarinimicrobiota bacterium]MCK9482991.1 Rid family detoxifying hydrolase [Candidatus Neomarinimicrobiota bacterium]MCK9558886.1 Rid family detoxifying hydrolase [Candidatus Neomarinimicrobiota bacterium]MDD5062417.1 Rid family detoxifying hydrolase [Candidatus Neomarinimicrobiota bacterium]MDD5230847.1 Rid family detoxifying hydrolase [Candidatus Neomarinimicrobiota bacterium]
MLEQVNRKVVDTPSAPRASGPYSQAIISNNFVFTAGQLPIDPRTGRLAAEDFEGQLRQVLRNLEAVLQAAGTDLKNVVKFTVFISDMANFSILNKVFSEYFPESAPARSAFQASRLPLDVLIEIEAIAVGGK